jgi:hypothetical protein
VDDKSLEVSEVRFVWGAVFGIVFLVGYVWLWRYPNKVKPQDRLDSNRGERDRDASSEEDRR